MDDRGGVLNEEAYRKALVDRSGPESCVVGRKLKPKRLLIGTGQLFRSHTRSCDVKTHRDLG